MTKRHKIPLITPALMREHNACWTDRKLRSFLGKGRTLQSVLKDNSISHDERLWCALCPGVLDATTIRLFACVCAERLLPDWESRCPDDERPRVAIQTAIAFAMSGNYEKEEDEEAAKEELDLACEYALYAYNEAYGYFYLPSSVVAAAIAASDVNNPHRISTGDSKWQVKMLLKMI